MSVYTEEEAAKKWCPHAVASHTDPRRGFRERQSGEAEEFPCLGSKCMAWRFMPRQWEHVAMGSPPSTYNDTNEIDGYGRKGKPLPHVGFCGLAGPQP